MVAIVIGVVVLSVLTFGVLPLLSADRRMKRELAAMPQTPIGQAQPGTIKIAGQVAHAYPPVAAPLSGRACTAYDVRVEERRGDKWVDVIREVHGQPFMVYDGTGRAFVAFDPQSILLLKKDVELTSQTLQDPTPAMQALLARHGVTSTRAFGLNKAIRYYEGVLEAGEHVTVHGVASREPEPDPAAAAAAGYPTHWVVMRAAPGVELRITDELPPAPPTAPPAR